MFIFVNCPQAICFSYSESNLGPTLCVFVQSPTLLQSRQFLSLCLLWAWHFWRLLTIYFIQCLWFEVCLPFLHVLTQVSVFGNNYFLRYHRNGILSFTGLRIRRYMMSLCLITGDVNFHHLLWAMSSRFCSFTVKLRCFL